MTTNTLNGVEVRKVDYKGRVYDRYFPSRDPGYGPGWYVFGRNPECGDRLISRVAQPDVPARQHKHYNPKVRRGWHTKREAQAIADRLNQGMSQ